MYVHTVQDILNITQNIDTNILFQRNLKYNVAKGCDLLPAENNEN